MVEEYLKPIKKIFPDSTVTEVAYIRGCLRLWVVASDAIESVTEGGGPWIMVTTFSPTDQQVLTARDDEGRQMH